MHGAQLRWHVHMSSEKSLECEWCSLDLVCSNLKAPMFLNGPTLQSLCDKYRKQEYHWVSLGIPSTFQKEIRWHILIGFGTDVLALKTKSIHLHLLETCYTGLQSISTYCCTYQSMNHDKLKSRMYFWTFITGMKICTDCGTLLTLYSKAISLSQVTSLCHTIEWYYLRTKSSGVGLDGPETTYLGDQFDNLVMAYPIFKDNFWMIFTWWNDIQLWHVFMLYKENIWSSVCIQ